MGNMSYCRMRNTLDDLLDCQENWEETTSEGETAARAALLRVCREIVGDYGDEDEEA